MIVRKLASMIAALAAIAGMAAPAAASENPAIHPLVRRATPIAPTWSAPLSFSDLVLRRPLRADITEVDVPGLPDTAMAEMTWTGPVIMYNPVLFREAGPAREFVRAHEYAHVILEHLENRHMIDTDEGRAEAEAEADCFAARSSSPLSVMAMVRLVLRRPAEARDSIYGTKPERAHRILVCAGISRS